MADGAKTKTTRGVSSADRNLHMVQALFADVIEGSINSRVDPKACIPLTQIRPVVRSGVERLKKLFRGRLPQKRGGPALCS